MSIPAALASLVSVRTGAAREIIPPPNGLSPFQKELQERRDCYEGKLFNEDCRRIPWGQRYDSLGREIDRKRWKPVVKPAIAKVIAKTRQAYLVGADRFPSISLVTKDKAPFAGLAPLEKVENPELAASLAQKRALQCYLDALMTEARFQQTVEDAVLKALIQKEQPVLLRFYGGLPYFTLPDRMWCDWGYSEKNPRQLAWFEERFFFKRKVKGKDATFFYKRRIDASLWSEWEVEITDKTKLNEEGELEMPAPMVSIAHGLGFVPVTIIALSESVFADEMICNIKGYIEYRNNIMTGVSGNMDPQRVLLRKPSDSPPPVSGPGDGEDDELLERGSLWELEGDSIQSFANDTEGYKVAQIDIAEAKDDLMQAGAVIQIPADNEQSGKALALRMAPQFSQAQRDRSDIGFGIAEMADQLVAGADKVALNLDCDIPTSLTDFTVQLDWGQLLPVTPEMIKLELENVDLATGGGQKMLSTRSGRRYTMPYFAVEDISEEEEQIEREEAEARELQVGMVDAAFERKSKEGKSLKDGENDED